MRAKPGTRVGAIKKSDEKNVYLFGYGTYDGDYQIAIFDDDPDFKINNPRITLDDGRTVWGCECWWGPEDKVKEMIGGREVIAV